MDEAIEAGQSPVVLHVFRDSERDAGGGGSEMAISAGRNY